jgi:hypothetical protein
MNFIEWDCGPIHGFTIQLANIQRWRYALIISKGVVYSLVDAISIIKKYDVHSSTKLQLFSIFFSPNPACMSIDRQ